MTSIKYEMNDKNQNKLEERVKRCGHEMSNHRSY